MPRPKSRRRPRRWRLIVLMVVLVTALATTTYVLLRTSSNKPRSHLHRSTGPTIEQIRLLQQLATLKMLVTDVMSTTTAGHTGSTEVILAVRAELTVGVDLSQAGFVSVDEDRRHAVLRLPEPELQQVTIDHTRSRVAALQSNGLWQFLPSDSSVDARLIDAAYREAERRLRETELSNDQRRHSRDQAVAVVHMFAARLGWTMEVTWFSAP